MSVERDPSIEIADLRAATTAILDAVERRMGSSVRLGADHYWLIPPSAAFAMENEPALEVGQLTDDVAELRASLGRDDDLVIWHDLQHVIAVLQRLASLDLPR
jgi:hypothetical protein